MASIRICNVFVFVYEYAHYPSWLEQLGDPANESTARFAEYGSTGPGISNRPGYLVRTAE